MAVGDITVSLIKGYTLAWINSPKFKEKTMEESSYSNLEVLLIEEYNLEQAAFYLELLGIKYCSQFNYIVDKCFEC